MDFATFWQQYPKKVAKKEAEKAWSRLSNMNRALALEALPNHLRAWAVAGTEKQYLPNAATWIRGERWEDEIELPGENWQSSEEATIRKGQVLGLMPRPGEDLMTYRNRIRERLTA